MKTTQCPECASQVEPRRQIWRVVVGAAFVLASVLLFFPTIGVSFVFGIYGVFMMVPRLECTSCKWHE